MTKRIKCKCGNWCHGKRCIECYIKEIRKNGHPNRGITRGKFKKIKLKIIKKKKHIHFHTCQRCRKPYYTLAKRGDYCDDCKKPCGFGGYIKYNEVNKDGTQKKLICSV